MAARLWARLRGWAGTAAAEIGAVDAETLRYGRQVLQFVAGVYVFDQHVAHLSVVSARAVGRRVGQPESWARPPRFAGRGSTRSGGTSATDAPSSHPPLTRRCRCRRLPQTNGPSMMPTLNELGDVVLVDKLSCGPLRLGGWAGGWDPITRGDVVVARSANKCVPRGVDVVRPGGGGGKGHSRATVLRGRAAT
jgi:hypothetical protein